MKPETDTQRMICVIEKNGGFIQLECGTWAFAPHTVYGGMSESMLRAVAAELKRRNNTEKAS